MRAAERFALAVLVAGFGWGIFTHAMDYVRVGWLPYAFGPPLSNAFWNALVLLDAVTVALLLVRRRAGLVLGGMVMVADVAFNVHAWLWLGIERFALGVAFQAAFGGFLLGSAPLLWLARRTEARPALSRARPWAS